MNVLGLPAAALTLAGRHGTLLAAASIFVGLAVPPLAIAFKPFLGEAIIAMLTLAFLRVDPAELRKHWSRPGLIAAATIWVMLVVPVLLGTLFLAFGLDQSMPGLFFMLVLQISAPGLMSSPALAAAVIRRFAGRAWIETQRERIDGLSVIFMFMFAVAAMDGVIDNFRANPLLVVELAALAFALALGLIGLTALIFLRAGRARALAIGLIAGNRNIGLMMTATGFLVPDVAWLYFALAQFPIYLLPHLLKPLATRLQQTR